MGIGFRDQTRADLSRQLGTGIGNPSGQAHSPNQFGLVHRRHDVIDPDCALRLHPLLQCLTQLGSHFTRCIVTSHAIGLRHHLAQITQRQIPGHIEGSLGPVQPVRRFDSRHEIVCQRQQWPGGNLRLTGSLQLGVLIDDGLAHGWDAAPKELLSHRLLLGG